MRRLDDVAAGVKHDLRRRLVFVRRAHLGRHARQYLGRQLQTRNGARAAVHRVEILLGAATDFGFAFLRGHAGDARHVDHEARVDAVIAGRNALAAIGANLCPTLGVGRAWAAIEKIEDAVDDRDGVGRIEPRRLGHRAGLDAFAASRTGVERLADPRLYRVHEPAAAIRHDATPSSYGPKTTGVASSSQSSFPTSRERRIEVSGATPVSAGRTQRRCRRETGSREHPRLRQLQCPVPDRRSGSSPRGQPASSA